MVSLTDLPEEVLGLIIDLLHRDNNAANSVTSQVWEDNLPTRTRQQHGSPSLKSLRRCCKILRCHIDKVLFSHIRVRRLDAAHTNHLEHVLRQFAMPAYVKTYTLAPLIVTTKPVVRGSPGDYYGEMLPSCGSYEPRYSELVAEHEMRTTIARHFNEQYRIIWAPELMSWWQVLYHGAIEGVITTSEPPYGSTLAQSVYIKAIHWFPNLRKLHIQFAGITRLTVTSQICKAINHQFATGLGKYLLTHPQNLTQLELVDVYLESISVLVAVLNHDTRNDIEEADVRDGNLKFLQELTLRLRNNVYDDGRPLSSDAFGDTNRRGFLDHKNKRSVSELIMMMPNLKSLDICFNDKGEMYTEYLELDIPYGIALPRLQTVHLYQLIVSAESLIRLTTNELETESWESHHSAPLYEIGTDRIALLIDERPNTATVLDEGNDDIVPAHAFDRVTYTTWADIFSIWSKQTRTAFRHPPPRPGSREHKMLLESRYFKRTSTTDGTITSATEQDLAVWQLEHEKYLGRCRK